MQVATLNGIRVHFSDEGPKDGLPVLFSNSLGTDFRVWNHLLPALPQGLRLIRYDTRGHGLSDCPEGAYYMGDLVADAAALLEHLQLRNAVVVGLSIGGMIAQGLAAERPDLVRALVLMDTAVKIGNPAMWAERIAAVEAGGIAALADATLERWFSRGFRAERQAELALWRHMLVRTPQTGYIGCSHAIAETDLYASTAALRQPTLAIVGAEDGSTPPDMVRETAGLIAGSRFEIIPRAGHLPGVEQPEITAGLIADFLRAEGLAG